jgi:hypothetical protein
MDYFDQKISLQLLKKSNDYFPDHNNKNIVKINDEQYSFWVGRIKMYVFDENEMISFLKWYWYNVKDSFIFDITNISNKIQYSYFSNNILYFKTNYPTVEDYNIDIIENIDCVNKFEKLINDSGGIDNFITNVIIFKNNYKKMEIKKIKNIKYLFAYDCGTIIERK